MQWTNDSTQIVTKQNSCSFKQIKFWELSKETKRDSKKRYSTNFRSSRSEVFCKNGVLKYFTKFTGKHLCWSLFFKNSRPEGCNFIKKRLQHRSVSRNFTKNFKTLFCRTSANRCFWNFLLKHDIETGKYNI